jgi:hypothetical protein
VNSDFAGGQAQGARPAAFFSRQTAGIRECT